MRDILTLEAVQLNMPSVSKKEAIKQAGELLVKAGYVTPDYVEGMLAREETMSTYLGHGLAIPHGQFEDKENIHSTGISIVQYPEGVLWDDDDDEIAYLVVGIAATANEHVGILSNLAEVIEEEEAAQELIRATDPRLIIERLTRSPEEED
ncbi:MAG: PTS sugar transporter subunit IIA [Chloroflexota bacterium]